MALPVFRGVETPLSSRDRKRHSGGDLALLPVSLVQWRQGRWVEVVHGRSRSVIEKTAQAMRATSPDAQLRILDHDGSNIGFQEALALLSDPHGL